MTEDDVGERVDVDGPLLVGGVPAGEVDGGGAGAFDPLELTVKLDRGGERGGVAGVLELAAHHHQMPGVDHQGEEGAEDDEHERDHHRRRTLLLTKQPGCAAPPLCRNRPGRSEPCSGSLPREGLADGKRGSLRVEATRALVHARYLCSGGTDGGGIIPLPGLVRGRGAR